MTHHFVHLSSLRRCHHLTIHITNGSSLSVAGQDTLCFDSFHVPDVSLIPDLTMQLMFAGHVTDHDCHVILYRYFCYIQDCRTVHLVGTLPMSL
jgi:hypothetical protein